MGVGHIVEHIPEDVPLLVSPFIGGGSVEIACAKELRIQVLAYDIFDILVNYWQVQLESADALAERLEQWESSKEQYAKIKQRLKAHWNKDNPIEDSLELAAHYWFNHNLSYGPGFLGWMSKIYESPKRYVRAVEKVRCFQSPTLAVEVGGSRKQSHATIKIFCIATHLIILMKAKCFEVSTHNAISLFTTRGLVTNYCVIYSMPTKEDLYSLTTIVRRSENGTQVFKCMKCNGSIR